MAIKVGQIRYSDTGGTTYLSPVSNRIVDSSTTTGSTRFTDSAISATFNAGVTYYVRVDIARININDDMGNDGVGNKDPHYQNIEVKLYGVNSEQYQTIGDIITVEPYSGGENIDKEEKFINWCDAIRNNLSNKPYMEDDLYIGSLDYFNNLKADHERKKSDEKKINNIKTRTKVIELIFTPYVTSDKLVFELNRVSFDYNYAGTAKERKVKISSDRDVGSVVNVLPAGIIAEKVGIQSTPSSYVIINGEGMRIGKSGVLEINSGIAVNSVGFAAPGAAAASGGDAAINDFILDYIYTS